MIADAANVAGDGLMESEPDEKGVRNVRQRIHAIADGTNSTRVEAQVANARFALGADNGAYLRSNVMPLQTSQLGCDSDRLLGQQVSKEIVAATRKTVLEALEEDYTKRLQAHGSGSVDDFELVSWLMSIKEIAVFVSIQLQQRQENKLLSDADATIECALLFATGTQAEEAKKQLKTLLESVNGERVLCLLLQGILAMFGKPEAIVTAQLLKTVGQDGAGEGADGDEGMRMLQRSLERLALTARHRKSVYEADRLPTDYKPDAMSRRIGAALVRRQARAAARAEARAAATAEAAMASGVINLAEVDTEPVHVAGGANSTRVEAPMRLDRLVRAASTGTSVDEHRRVVKQYNGRWDFDERVAKRAFDKRKAEKGEAAANAEAALNSAEAVLREVEARADDQESPEYDQKEAQANIPLMKQQVEWQRAVHNAKKAYAKLLDRDEPVFNAIAAFVAQVWENAQPENYARVRDVNTIQSGIELDKQFRDALNDEVTQQATQSADTLQERERFTRRWVYNIAQLVQYEEDFQELPSESVLERIRMLTGEALDLKQPVLEWIKALLSGDATWIYKRSQQKDISLLTRLLLFKQYFLNIDPEPVSIWATTEWAALVTAVTDRNAAIAEAVSLTQNVLNAANEFERLREERNIQLEEAKAAEEARLQSDAERQRQFVEQFLQSPKPSFCKVAPYIDTNERDIERIDDALCAAFTQLREGTGFREASGPLTQGNEYVRLRRVEGISPFFNAPRERDGYELPENEVGDWWDKLLWPDELEFVEVASLPEVVDSYRRNGKWLETHSYNEGSRPQRRNIRDFDVLHKFKRHSVGYALARGLCASRAPYHQVDGSALQYSLPAVAWPGAKAFKALNESLAITPEETQLQATVFTLRTIDSVADFVEPANKGSVEEVERPLLALWAPVRRAEVPSRSGESGNVHHTFVAEGNDERVYALCDSVVLEHLVDHYNQVAREAASGEVDGKSLQVLALGAAAFAKVLQLPSLCAVMHEPDASVCAPIQEMKDGVYTFVTRPVLRCPTRDRQILYPCDAGLASYELLPPGSEPRTGGETVYPPEAGNAFGRVVGDYNEATLTKRVQVERSEATSYMRSILSRNEDSEAGDSSKPPTKRTSKVPLYVAEAPGATGDEMIDVLSALTKRSTAPPPTKVALPNTVPDMAVQDNKGVLEVTAIATRLREAVQRCSQHLSLQDALKAVKKELTEEQKQTARPNESTNMDSNARERRQAVWNDAMREACISGDRLYAFARQLAGTISEQVDSVCMIDEGMLIRQQQDRQQARERIVDRAAQEQMQLVRNVFAAVIKESGLTLGIEKSGDLGDLGQLKVVSNTLRKQASEIASGGSSSEGYFSSSVRLENLLATGTGEMTLGTLFQRLGEAGKAIQEAALSSQSSDSLLGGGTSLDFLSAPRNSLVLRWKPESLAAIRHAFDLFTREMEHQHGYMYRNISAYELVEGCDDALCAAFAQFAAHCLVHSRMYSSATAMYVAAWPAAANAQQLKVALHRLTNLALDYLSRTPTPAFLSSEGRANYFGGAQTNAGGSVVFGLPAVVGRHLPQIGGLWRENMYGNS